MSVSTGASPFGSVTLAEMPLQSPTCPSSTTLAAHTSADALHSSTSTNNDACCGYRRCQCSVPSTSNSAIAPLSQGASGTAIALGPACGVGPTSGSASVNAGVTSPV